MLNENRDKISGSDVQNLESAISEARKAMEQGGVDNMTRATENLQKASHKLAEAMYAQQGANAGAQQSGSTGGGQQTSESSKDDVIEAEVVDENK
jgi:molecular chaperone DnaK